jgi:GSH-dependent disulfide-bond oxidoreductase
VAGEARRPPAALFVADAQRRQSLDRAGGDRFALRAAPRRLRQGRPTHAGVPLAQPPNGKIPAIIDPDGPGGKPLALFESGAILVYLADKTGKLVPADPARRYETIQWVFFQMAFIGPMFGQVGYFHKFAGREIADKRPLERYRDESKRLLGVLDQRLAARQWIMDDDYTIADISMLGWVRNLIGFYGARELVSFDELEHVPAWLERGLARPAVQRGLDIPKRG